jgi:ribosomal protein S18 acetylase RimI-like enzyme
MGSDAEDGVGIRPATPRDEALFRDLYASLRWPELTPTAWPDAEKRAFCDMQYGLQDRHYRAHFPGAEPMAIVVSGATVGRVYRALSADTLNVLDIALVAEMRGRGIGTRLMSAMQADAARAGQRIVLHIEEHNPIQRWYERLGFTRGALLGAHREMIWSPGTS